jgi:hypothetical protein
MSSNQRHWLYYGSAVAAIVCSLLSLFALVTTGAPTWITALNILAIVLVLLALKVRSSASTQAGLHDSR